MKYRIQNKKAFTIMGKETLIRLEDKHAMLTRFWTDCHANGTIASLHELAGDGPIMGAGENVIHDGKFIYMIGIEGESTDTGAMKIMEIPKSTWVIFEPVLSEPKMVGAMWDYIFNDFLPNGKYNLANTPDLEVNHKVSDSKYMCEIWIPVIEKD